MQRRLAVFLALSFAAFPSLAAITGVVMSTDGQPISGAKVSIRGYESSEARAARLLSATPEPVPIATASTDAKGNFSLESPKEAVVYLGVEARGFAPEQKTIERDEDAGAIALVKAESRTAKITAAGKPLPNATVALGYGAYEYVTRTNGDGAYTAPASTRLQGLTVIHPDYAIDQRAPSLRSGGLTAAEMNRTLTAGTPLKGMVVGPDGTTPVAKATVGLDTWPLAVTADDGTFTIAHAPAKWTRLWARKDALLGQRDAAKEPALQTIRLAKAPVITGRAIDGRTKTPVAGVTVEIGARRFGMGASVATALTDAKGAFSMTVPPGTYSMIADHPGYTSSSVDVAGLPGQQVSKDLTLTQRARVSGTVVDEGKKGVVAAVVVPEESEASAMGWGGGPGEQQFSGPDGRFSMRVDADLQYQVRATKKGLPTAKSDSFRLTPGERKSGVTVVIPTGFAVSGRVTDGDGKPLSGVAVKATEAEPGNRGMTRVFFGGPTREDDSILTGSDGTYTLRVKEGAYDFGFSREGYAPKTVRGQTVSASSQTKVDATLDPAVEISGRVTRAGTPIENAFVSAMTSGNSSATSTGPDGSFTVGGLSAGSVRLMVRKMDDFVQEMRNVTAPARDVVIDLPAGGRVTGRVTEKGSSKAITVFQAGISTSGQGGGMVRMGPPQLRDFNSEDGTFTLDNVPAGAVVLVASAPGYASARLNLTVEEGKTVNNANVELDQGTKLIGHVSGANGAGLSDVEVRILPSATGGFAMGAMSRSASTDANGDYVLDGLSAGEETVSFSAASHAPVRKTVTLKGRETRLDVQLAAGTPVTGTVTTDSGSPVADATVQVMGGGAFGAERTKADGSFEIDGLAPGRYRFVASKSGFADGVAEDVDVSSGAPVRITMHTGGTIYGHVSGLSKEELATASVDAFANRLNTSASVDAAGNYKMEGVPIGTVRLNATASKDLTGRKTSTAQTVDVTAGSSQQVDFAFRDDVVIRGRVSRNGAPVKGGNIMFYPRTGQTQASASTAVDDQGQYSVSGLDEAEYNVVVMDEQRFSPYTTTYQVRGSGTFDVDYRTAALRGRVIDVASGEPIANATVNLRSTTPAEGFRMPRASVTDAAGTFLIDSVAPGGYTLTGAHDGYGNEVQDITVTESGTDNIELKLSRNDGVMLTIVDARDGRNLAGSAVVFDQQGRVVHDGRPMFGGGGDPAATRLPVAPGSYTATVGANGYAPRTVSFQSPSTQKVALTPGGTLLVTSKHSEPRRFRLIDASGFVYPHYDSSNRTRELTPNPGTTTIPNVASGTYTIQLLGDGDAVVDSRQVTVQEGQVATAEI